MNNQKGAKPAVIPAVMVFPFIMVTTLFALWGFANDITNPMVAAFKNVLLISNFESSLVQFAFYGGYCIMAIPAALFIKRFSYKSGIVMGLLLYALGCLLFIPAGHFIVFWAFLVAYFVMTCVLSFLETSANPYILSMDPPETATRRLNFAQAFNPIGSLTGMLVAKNMILAKLDSTSEAARRTLQTSDPAALLTIRDHDIDVIIGPYVTLGTVVFAVMVLFISSKPAPGKSNYLSVNRGDPAMASRLSGVSGHSFLRIAIIFSSVIASFSMAQTWTVSSPNATLAIEANQEIVAAIAANLLRDSVRTAAAL